ncbi:hypothetical protein [Aurantimonas coralicida]|uniref:hypothetical protein n=1 Tax=Aurantimonas coralicida TaxID=182270 RepID=UPI001E41FE77|nr:hypothetical protein [Aurantimonas coralicida]MCD1644178.1 hypothetical protein [Aurantimonas coralicida]
MMLNEMMKDFWCRLTRRPTSADLRRQAAEAEVRERKATEADLIARGFTHYAYRPCDPRVHEIATFASVHSGQIWDAAPDSLDPRMNAYGLYWRPIDYADFEELPPQRVISHSVH